MAITAKTILKELRDAILFLLVSLLQAFLMCPKCTVPRFFSLVVFTFFVWFVLWKGNSLLSRVLSSHVSWTKMPLRRFLIGIIVTGLFTVLAVLALIEAFEYVTGDSFGKAGVYIVYGAVISTFLISLFLHSRQFLMSWRKASLQKETFEKESIAARYEALRNQVSPHFLFNSLNALTNLVHENPDQAVNFIKQLSEVYRYVLETREKEVVPLSDELKFLDSYVYLQRIRFGKKLTIKIGRMPANAHVAPLALQMLIENAIKHNVVSEDDPLTIELRSEDGYLVVENNLQKKAQLEYEPPSGIGLANICKRYEYLSEAKVIIIENSKVFIVKLPALQANSDENPDN